jgi:hypothetical protein
MHADDALVFSGLISREMHLRRERISIKAQKAARIERTFIVNEVW